MFEDEKILMESAFLSGDDFKKQFTNVDPKWEKGQGPFTKRYWYARANNKLLGFIDLTGKELFPPVFKAIEVNTTTFKTTGLILNPVSYDGKKWGVLDVMNGKLIIPCIYPMMVWFIGEYAEICPNIFIDMSGKRVKDLNLILDYQNRRNQMILNSKSTLYRPGKEKTLVNSLDEIGHTEYEGESTIQAQPTTNVYDDAPIPTPPAQPVFTKDDIYDPLLKKNEPTLEPTVTQTVEPTVTQTPEPEVKIQQNVSLKDIEVDIEPGDSRQDILIKKALKAGLVPPPEEEVVSQVKGEMTNINFEKSSVDAPYIIKILKMYAQQNKIDGQTDEEAYKEVKHRYDEMVKGKQETYSKIPMLKQMADNAPEDVLFSKFVDKMILPKDEFGNNVFYNDRDAQQIFQKILAANGVTNPRSFIIKKYKNGCKPTYITLPTNTPEFSRLNSCSTACCTADLVVAFNKDFVEKMNFIAFMKGTKPKKGWFYKSISQYGTVPDYWCSFEFLVMHEIWHFMRGDLFAGLSKVCPNGRILNYASDFINNATLLRLGLTQLPCGMYSDVCTTANPKIKDTIDAYNLIQEEFKKLSNEDVALVNEALKQLPTDKHIDNGKGDGSGSLKDLTNNLNPKYSLGRVLLDTVTNQYVVIYQSIPVNKATGEWRYRVLPLSACGTDIMGLSDRIRAQVIDRIKNNIREAFEGLGCEILNGKGIEDNKTKAGFNLHTIIRDVKAFIENKINNGAITSNVDEEDLDGTPFQLLGPKQEQGQDGGGEQPEQDNDEEQPDFVPEGGQGGGEDQGGQGGGDSGDDSSEDQGGDDQGGDDQGGDDQGGEGGYKGGGGEKGKEKPKPKQGGDKGGDKGGDDQGGDKGDDKDGKGGKGGKGKIFKVGDIVQQGTRLGRITKASAPDENGLQDLVIEDHTPNTNEAIIFNIRNLLKEGIWTAKSSEVTLWKGDGGGGDDKGTNKDGGGGEDGEDGGDDQGGDKGGDKGTDGVPGDDQGGENGGDDQGGDDQKGGKGQKGGETKGQEHSNAQSQSELDQVKSKIKQAQEQDVLKSQNRQQNGDDEVIGDNMMNNNNNDVLSKEELNNLRKKIREESEKFKNQENDIINQINQQKEFEEKNGPDSEPVVKDNATGYSDVSTEGTKVAKVTPLIDWDVLLKKVVKVTYNKVETYSKLAKDAVTRMPQLMTNGYMVYKPGSKLEKGKKVGLVVVIDESGSMASALNQATSEIRKLLLTQQDKIRDIWFIRFSSKWKMHHMIPGKSLKFKSFVGTDFSGFQKALSLTNTGDSFTTGGAVSSIEQMLETQDSGLTNFNENMCETLMAFHDASYNIMFFTDYDIYSQGSNIIKTKKIINHCKKVPFSCCWFLADLSDYKGWLEKKLPYTRADVTVILPNFEKNN